MSYPYDFTIIGGGISGLYITNQLMKKYPDKTILLIENDKEFGGRLRTQYEKGFQVEKGGARFSENHKKLIHLIKEFQLQEHMVKISNHKEFIYHNQLIKYDLSKKLKDIFQKSKSLKQGYLQKITLFQLCVDLYGYEEAKKIQSLFGYDAEFIRLNAYAALHMFSHDLFGNDQYYVLSCGLSKLIQLLGESIQDNPNITISLETEVTNIDHRRVTYEKDKQIDTISCLQVICTIPYLECRKLDIFKEYEYIHKVKPIPLLRVYVKYPKQNGKVWFHNLEKITTDNYLRYIIPINSDQGIIMYYMDSYNANMWNDLCKLGKDTLIDIIHKQVKDILHIQPPKPLKIKCCYWKGGVHMWKPGINYKDISKKLLKPFEDKDIYLSNEAWSTHQCWIEGALDMADKVLYRIENPKHKKKSLKK